MIVFDVTDRQTFEKSQTWITELNEKAPAQIVLSLVGNKIDLTTDRKVTNQEADDYAKGLGLKYFEVSAKENINIEDMFLDIAKALPRESQSRRGRDTRLRNADKSADQSAAGSCSTC